MAYLRLVYNPFDSVSLRRVINVPTRGIGTGTWQKIEQKAIEQNISLWDVVSNAGEIEGVKGTARKGLEAFVTLIAYLKGKQDELTVTKILEEIIENTRYVKELESERSVESQTRIENIKELLTVTKQFEETTENPTLGAFLEQTALIADVDSLDQSTNVVTLMTLHAAKGLEFPVVFLTGLEEGVFPHARSMQSDKEMEEERRLAYVGITRAKQELFLTFADRRTLLATRKSPSRPGFCAKSRKSYSSRRRGAEAGLAGAADAGAKTNTRRFPRGTKRKPQPAQSSRPNARRLLEPATPQSLPQKAGVKRSALGKRSSIRFLGKARFCPASARATMPK